MSVSLYYSARRAAPLTGSETAAVERVLTAHLSSFPFAEGDEPLCLYDGGGRNPEHVLAGSTKMPLKEDRTLPFLEHLMASVTRLRRAVPDADWHVHLDDMDLPWDEERGYGFPGE